MILRVLWKGVQICLEIWDIKDITKPNSDIGDCDVHVAVAFDGNSRPVCEVDNILVGGGWIPLKDFVK